MITTETAKKRTVERDHSALLRRIVMPALLVLLIVFFTIMSGEKFFSWYNFKNMLSQTAYVVVAGIGLTFVMIAGGIDLSIGYQMSLAGVLAGILMIKAGLPIWISIILVMVLGVLMGLFNGLICVKLNVFPMIITLSTSMIFQGLSFTVSGAKNIIGFDKAFLFLGQGYIGPIPFCAILAAVVALVAAFVLNRTYFGRYIYAIGGNEEAAHLAGINTGRMKIIVYGICGFFSALAALMLVARSASSTSNIGPGTEFTALSGCILGGVTLTGGEGSIGGMVVGALIITVLGNGMQIMGMGTYPQYIAKGIVLIAAMAFDVYQKTHKKVKAKIEA